MLAGGYLTLGSTLKRATERLYEAVDEIYARDATAFRAAWFPVFAALRERGPLPVSAVAEHIGQSHAAVSQVSKKLDEHGLVCSARDSDRRRRTLSLTHDGQATAARLQDVWTAITERLGEQLELEQADLLTNVAHLESLLANRAWIEDVVTRAARARRAALKVRPLRPSDEADAAAFRQLNEEWLERYFEIEPKDVELLGDPVGKVLEPGGIILLAELHGTVVGTCALLHEGRRTYELSKMAITETCRGLGLGRRLLDAAFERYRELAGRRLFLESSSKLAPALSLYESVGFEHAPRPGGPSPYARADVYMVWRGRPA